MEGAKSGLQHLYDAFAKANLRRCNKDLIAFSLRRGLQ